ncbi:BRISC and BRCA1-A complex member 1-like [Neodiprion virginianus]|uniref:BRISC and BRCA1-A complex member 1 n=1 Tax=Neodiprion lecontei TaxID=441921 RepID=A0A6J0BDL7_NEOLC|nr:BRISC and BRCA1-A complex member 1 [Neodiprion lecontei]XP_046614111.1 BRISC and BRCA1-A complex member 1-like [Neodiprion virginianus]
MIDNQDSNDEIQSMARRFQTVTTIENIVSGARQATQLTNPLTSIRENHLAATMPTQHHNKQDVKKEVGTCKTDESDMVRSLPEINLPEKIVLIIDITKEKDCTQFKLGTGATYMPMFLIKRVVEIFVGAKSMINRNHEFAIMTLCSESIKWVCDFTANIKTVLNTLDSLVEEKLNTDDTSFDLSQVFEALITHTDLPRYTESNEIPSFITRAILIYSRSNCIPRFRTGNKFFELLSDNPYFVLDALFVHEPPSSENMCEEVYNELTALDAKNLSYILEVGRNATKLHDNMAKLLAHPMQRPLQKNACYTICIPGTKEETHSNV